MNTPIRPTVVFCFVALVTVAATPETPKRLTVQRVAELASTADAAGSKTCTVDVSGIGRLTLTLGGAFDRLFNGREFIFPTEFDPPQAAASSVTPTTPTGFETVNTGWTLDLRAERHGKLVAIVGTADYVEVTLAPGGYGAVAGPIHSEQGDVLTENKMDLPIVKTRSTRFHLFAEPGQCYEVTLHRGDKEETHQVTVTFD